MKNLEPTYSCLTFSKARAERNPDKLLTHFSKKNVVKSTQTNINLWEEKSPFIVNDHTFLKTLVYEGKAQETRLFENYMSDV